jgi:hypothetical protein
VDDPIETGTPSQGDNNTNKPGPKPTPAKKDGSSGGVDMTMAAVIAGACIVVAAIGIFAFRKCGISVRLFSFVSCFIITKVLTFGYVN